MMHGCCCCCCCCVSRRLWYGILSYFYGRATFVSEMLHDPLARHVPSTMNVVSSLEPAGKTGVESGQQSRPESQIGHPSLKTTSLDGTLTLIPTEMVQYWFTAFFWAFLPVLSQTVGLLDGESEGLVDGSSEGNAEGLSLGWELGLELGWSEGSSLGSLLGRFDGCADLDGDADGDVDGAAEGAPDGETDGSDVGGFVLTVNTVGDTEGATL